MPINTPNIPALSSKVDVEVRRAIDAVKTWLAAINKEGGLVTPVSINSDIRSGATGALADILTPTIPAGVSGFQATGAFATIMLTWLTNPKGIARVEVWRNTLDDLGSAQLVGSTTAEIYVDTPPGGSISVTYYYWARYISSAGVAGPFNSNNGTYAATSNDPTYVLGLLSGQITDSQLHQSLSTPINALQTSVPEAIAQLVLNADNMAWRVASANTGVTVAKRTLTEQSDSISAIAEEVLTLGVSAGDNLAYISETYSTKVNTTSAIATAKTELLATTGNNLSSALSSYSTTATMNTAIATAKTQAIADSATATSDALTAYTTTSGLSSAVSSIMSTTVASLNATFYTTTAPTQRKNGGVLVNGDVWYDLANNNRVKTWLNGSWVDVTDSRITANTSAITVEQQARAATTAPDFSVATAYPKNAVVMYGSPRKLYRNKTGDTVASGAWSASNWTEITADLFAQYSVRTDVNGKIVGFGLSNDGTTSNFEVIADRFAVLWPDNQQVWINSKTYVIGEIVRHPDSAGNFYRSKQGGNINHTPQTAVQVPPDGNDWWQPIDQVAFGTDPAYGLVIDSAVIKNGSIGGVKIGSQAVDSSHIADLAVGEEHVADGAITNLKIGGTIQSTDWNAATREGWLIDKAGNIQGKSLVVEDASVTTIKIANNAATVPVGAFSSGSVSLIDNTYVEIQTASITLEDDVPIFIQFSFVGTDGVAWGRLKRGTTTVWGTSWSSLSTRSCCIAVKDNPGVGGHVYSLELSVAGTGHSVTNRALLLTGYRR